jgi:hypothetical protein
MIIGIAGHARHGKDTAADILVNNFGYHKLHLADPMKEACRIIFGWTDAHLHGDLKDEIDPRWGISPRHALQTLGTEWGQHKLSEYDSFAEVTGRKLWVRSLLSRVRGSVVVADVRFPHEAEEIKARGGKIIMIHRPGQGWDKTHSSERDVELIKPDLQIRNGGTIKQLEQILLEELKEKSWF